MSDVFMLTGSLLMFMIILLFIFKAIGSFTVHTPSGIYISPTVKNISPLKIMVAEIVSFSEIGSISMYVFSSG